MALINDFIYKGIQIEKAYCRISTVACQKDAGVTFQIDVYYNKETSVNVDNILFSLGYTKEIDLNSEVNIFIECYNYLKTNVADWSSAENCL